MEGLFEEVAELEGQLQEEMKELARTIAPLNVLQKRLSRIVEGLRRLEEVLREGGVAAAGLATLEESQRAKEALGEKKKTSERLWQQVRELKGKVRSNAEKHGMQEREALEDNSFGGGGGGKGEEAEKRSALRRAERGTGAMREAAAALRREAERMAVAQEETAAVSALFDEAVEGQRYLAGELRTGRSLVSRLARRHLTDRILIAFATASFFAVVAYILKKRMFG